MSEILVNTIKKADGTGSITVPADSGTLLTSASNVSVKYAFSAYNNTTQSISQSTQTVMQFNTERYDIGSNYDTSTHKFTAPVDGVYHFGVSMRRSNTFTGNEETHLLVNGSQVKRIYEFLSTDTNNYPKQTTYTLQWKLTAGDEVQMQFFTQGVSAQIGHSSSSIYQNEFFGYLVGTV